MVSRKDSIAIIVLFILPFFYFYRQVIDGQWFSRSMAIDFSQFYPYKVYLLDYLSRFRFPLWSPSEAAGFPLYSSALSQALYPLNIPLAVFYKISGGFSYVDYQRFTVVGISIFLVGCYVWLRSLKTSALPAFYGAVISGLSFRLSETIRFPNAVHAAAWYPWVLYGMTTALKKDTRLLSFCVITVSLVCLITAGYPYFVYYALFLFPVYGALLIISLTRCALTDSSMSISWRSFFGVLVCAAAVAILLSGPYLYKMFELMTQTYNRSGQTLAWSGSSGGFSTRDSWGSIFFPPAASIEGWYYFGFANIFLILFLFLHTLFYHLGDKRRLVFLFIIAAWFLLVSIISYGHVTPLFLFLWKHIPGFSSLRAWARINIILLPIIALAVSRAFASFCRLLVSDSKIEKRSGKRYGLLFLVFLSMGVGLLWKQHALHQLLQSYYQNSYWYVFVRNLGVDKDFYLMSSAVSFLSVSVLLALRAAIRSRRAFERLTAVTLGILFLWDVGSLANNQWTVPWTPEKSERRLIHMDSAVAASFGNVHRTNKSNIKETGIQLGPSFTVGFAHDWYFDRYVRFRLRNYIDGDVAESRYFDRVMGVTDGRRIFFSSAVSYPSVEQFLSDIEQVEKESGFAYTVEVYNGDRLNLGVSSRKAGFVHFIDNWDPDWEAYIDGGRVKMEQLFGIFKSVYVPSGEHAVVFLYNPKIKGIPLFVWQKT